MWSCFMAFPFLITTFGVCFLRFDLLIFTRTLNGTSEPILSCPQYSTPCAPVVPSVFPFYFPTFQWVSKKPTGDCRLTFLDGRTISVSPHRLKREAIVILTDNPEKRVESAQSRAKTDETNSCPLIDFDTRLHGPEPAKYPSLAFGFYSSS